MTIAGKLAEDLTDHGLWPKDIAAILPLVFETYKQWEGRWHEEITGYPPGGYALLWIGTKDIARQWLLGNKPDHFALPMFVKKM